MLEILLICLFSLSTLLFILSFFRKDKLTELEKQIDQISITYMQEMYILKNKIRLLEDELLISSEQSTAIKQNHRNSHSKLLEEIIDLYEKGYDIQSISNTTKLTQSEVSHLLDSHLKSSHFQGV